MLTGSTAISTLGFRSHFIHILIFALISSLAIQIATNFFNDALDYEKGADTSDRVGPARMAAMGLISSSALKKAALVALSVALLAGLPLVYWGGWVIFVIGLVSLFLAFGYTGGPFALAYRGLGEVFVLLFFGFIPAYALAYLLSLDFTVIFSPVIFFNGLVAGSGSAVLMAINNLRDLEQDSKVGKRTLAVRLGPKRFSWLIYLMVLLSYFPLAGYGVLTGKSLYAVAFTSCILVCPLLRGIESHVKGEYVDWASLLGRGGQWAFLHGVLISLIHLL
jgi:1,4-dihydroxy-2-naphthoate octaprenyltransferase